jgi:hypothetical protein
MSILSIFTGSDVGDPQELDLGPVIRRKRREQDLESGGRAPHLPNETALYSTNKVRAVTGPEQAQFDGVCLVSCSDGLS